MQGQAVNVLLVEDNDIDVEAVQRAFRKQRIANPLFVAKDGVEALERLRGENAIPRPYLILLDLNMPRMNGIEFLEAIRDDEQLKDSIVFVLTTSKRDEDKVASYQFNVAGYVVKNEVGESFLHLTEMLECYWRVIEFPPENV